MDKLLGFDSNFLSMLMKPGSQDIMEGVSELLTMRISNYQNQFRVRDLSMLTNSSRGVLKKNWG
jgi:hypothetical protein